MYFEIGENSRMYGYLLKHNSLLIVLLSFLITVTNVFMLSTYCGLIFCLKIEQT